MGKCPITPSPQLDVGQYARLDYLCRPCDWLEGDCREVQDHLSWNMWFSDLKTIICGKKLKLKIYIGNISVLSRAQSTFSSCVNGLNYTCWFMTSKVMPLVPELWQILKKNTMTLIRSIFCILIYKKWLSTLLISLLTPTFIINRWSVAMHTNNCNIFTTL